MAHLAALSIQLVLSNIVDVGQARIIRNIEVVIAALIVRRRHHQVVRQDARRFRGVSQATLIAHLLSFVNLIDVQISIFVGCNRVLLRLEGALVQGLDKH